MRAAVIGLAGPALLPAEAALLRDLPPAGVILFGRNVQDRDQLRRLTDALRRTLPTGALIAVDQEGGRVARLRPPHWTAHPPAAAIGALHDRSPEAGRRAAFLTGALIGRDAREAGFSVVCAPVLDLRVPGATDAIGDRAFGAGADTVAACGLAMTAGLVSEGVLPVGKHAPGHGRATLDSHLALPIVPADAPLDDDIAAFRACATLPCMMTAHLLYEGLDPHRPATLSPVVIGDVIRGRIGFAGTLLSDDLAMKALQGPPGALAAAALAAGCDLALHCSGVLADTEAVLRACPPGRRPPPVPAAVAGDTRAAMLAERRELLAC